MRWKDVLAPIESEFLADYFEVQNVPWWDRQKNLVLPDGFRRGQPSSGLGKRCQAELVDANAIVDQGLEYPVVLILHPLRTTTLSKVDNKNTSSRVSMGLVHTIAGLRNKRPTYTSTRAEMKICGGVGRAEHRHLTKH